MSRPRPSTCPRSSWPNASGGSAAPTPTTRTSRRAAEAIRAAKRPLIIAGGGVLYAYANDELAKFAELTGIPVGNTQAGVGVLPWDHQFSLGAIGSTGTTAANAIAAEADLIIGIGTRYEDFTTASRTAFQNPDVKFININVAAIDAYKHGTSLPIVADARKALVKLNQALGGYRVGADLEQQVAAEKKRWDATVDEAFDTRFTPAAGPERDHRRHLPGHGRGGRRHLRRRVAAR